MFSLWLCSYNQLLYSSENKEIIATYCNNMEESQKYNAEPKKPDTKNYILLMFTYTHTKYIVCDFIYTKSKNSENLCSFVSTPRGGSG